MAERRSVRYADSVLVCLAILVSYLLLAAIVPRQTLLAIGLYVAVLAVYLGWSYYVIERRPAYRHVFSPATLGVVLACCTVLVVMLGWVPPSPVALVHLAAVVLVFVYLFVVLVAFHQSVTTTGEFDSVSEYPSIAVLVPAYNEEGYVGRTIESLLAANYPDGKKRVVVVDDGSTDGTYDEARQYESDTVTVVRKRNGGKYSALNYGLLFSDAEIVVTVDADSVVENDALIDVVAPFESDPDIGAVAGSVYIFNRDSFVAKCQILEYVLGINTYRRVFDHLGAVSIVPGCLGAYRRSALDDVLGYDPETLTEDFDTTMKVLNRGYKVRFSEAVVYTEAPDTWRDLYNQRLRWYRGNIMTVRKHLLGAVNSENRYLRRIHLPMALVTMVFLPLASWVILAVIGYVVLTSGFVEMLAIFTIFTSIIVFSNLLAVKMEGESLRYVLYSPLFVIGYKHFHDVVMVKSLLDVLGDSDLGWTNATRVDQRETTVTEPATESQTE